MQQAVQHGASAVQDGLLLHTGSAQNGLHRMAGPLLYHSAPVAGWLRRCTLVACWGCSLASHVGQVQKAVVCGPAGCTLPFLQQCRTGLVRNSLASTRPSVDSCRDGLLVALVGVLFQGVLFGCASLLSARWAAAHTVCFGVGVAQQKLCMNFALVGVSLLKAAAAVESAEGLRGCILYTGWDVVPYAIFLQLHVCGGPLPSAGLSL